MTTALVVILAAAMVGMCIGFVGDQLFGGDR